jgi:putative copper export protein
MKNLILTAHLLCAGLWLGCVLTEVLFERALLGQGREAERTLARLHWRVDAWIEVPALSAVVATGLALLPLSAPSGLLYLKIGLALLAVLANLCCVALVLKRLRHARRSEWPEFEAADRLQHRIGALVLLGLLLAAGIGLGMAAP